MNSLDKRTSAEDYNHGFATGLREMAKLIESNPRPVEEIIKAMRMYADAVEPPTPVDPEYKEEAK